MLYQSFDDDREYLINKFRAPVMDPATGLTNDEIRAKILDAVVTWKEQPVSMIKGHGFEFICRNMQIDVNPHDCFPGFGCYDRHKRPIAPLISSNYSAVYEKYLKNTVGDSWAEQQKAGLITIWPDFDHSVPDWDSIFALGFPGLRDRARNFRAQHQKNGTLTYEVAAYFDSMEITWNAVLECIGRLLDYAREHHGNHPRIQREIRCLEQMRTGAPRDTYEFLMIIYLYFFFAEHIDHMQVRSLSNLDAEMLRYYKKDLAEGRYTMDEIREFITCFFMQWASIDNYWGHPLYLGGTAPDGGTLYNECSALILEIFDELAIPTPKIQLKIAKHTPDWLLKQALRMVRDHNSSLVFISDENAQELLISQGFSKEEARICPISGCYELAPRDSNGTGTGHINMLKCLELALNNGYSKIGDYQCKSKTMRLEDMKTFDDFYQTVLIYLDEIIQSLKKIAFEIELHLGEINPGQMFSSTNITSLTKGIDAFSSGTTYKSSGILLCGLGTTVDALMAVKKAVFDEKLVTLEEFRDILNNNWEGAEKLRLKMLHCKEKYGNGIPEVDQYANKLVKFAAARINRHPSGRGGYFSMSGHCARQFIVQGEKTSATPDGRKEGEEFSKNLSPTMGADTNGLTALSRSVCAMDYHDLPGDFPLDVMLHPATVQGEEGLEAMKNYIFSHYANGGMQIHFNVFDAQTLIDAAAHPENYRNLQVRVCGWNVRFVELNEKEQNMYITRALHIAE